MGKTTIPETPLIVPSPNPLEYCRLCFSTNPCKKIVTLTDALHWVDYIQRTVGLELKAEDDVPFALCFGCKAALESVEQFRFTCRLHDSALRQFRAQAAGTGGNAGAGESTNTTVRVQIPPAQSAVVRVQIPRAPMLIPRVPDVSAGVPPLVPLAPDVSGGGSMEIQHTADVSEDVPALIPIAPEVSEGVSLGYSKLPTFEQNCLVCELKFTSLREYRKHMRITHVKEGGIIPCPLCPRQFRKDVVFQRHVLKHRKEKKCRHCKAVFPTAKELGKHEEEQHELSFECRLCFSRFATKQEKNAHKQIHLSVKNRGIRKYYTCRICSRVFPNRHCLGIHVKKHEKCYICFTCGIKLATMTTYVEHQTTVHQWTAPMEECILCSVRFNSRDEFLNHLNLQHVAYDVQDLPNDELSEADEEQTANEAVSSATTTNHPGQSQQQPELEPETVSLSSSDDFPIYLDDDDDDAENGESMEVADEQQESARRGLDIANRYAEEFMQESEAAHDSGFDLYGTAFQPQISVSLIEELSD